MQDKLYKEKLNKDKPYKAVLIVGCGYIGRRVASLLQADGCCVTGCVRSEESQAGLAQAGINALRVDLDGAVSDAAWTRGFDAVLYLAPPPPEGDRDTRMQAFLQALDVKAPPIRIVYISTSAVYGDCQGAWITESRAVKPETARGRRRLDAEQQLRSWCESQAVEWTVLRVPGIYGPDKLPLARLRAGTPVLRAADAPYTNRIHGDDLAMICVAAMNSQHADVIYNISDGHPGNMTDYFFRVADAAGLPRPPTVNRSEAEHVLSRGMLSFLQDSRRLRNARMLTELGITLRYPDLASGLQSCFKD